MSLVLESLQMGKAKRRLTPVQQLRERAEPLVGGGDRLLGAFEAVRGARPGIEVFAAPVFGLLGALGVMKTRKLVSVVVTEQSVELWRNRRRLEPGQLVQRFEGHDALGKLQGSGDYFVEVGGEKYWLYLFWIDEVRRLNRLTGRD